MKPLGEWWRNRLGFVCWCGRPDMFQLSPRRGHFCSRAGFAATLAVSPVKRFSAFRQGLSRST